ncbi:MAG: VanR-ABDEGLN family response regulator transcription factor [Ruminococcaceae bacterium]|nr:VanR-ABDEGLN family response regulator transcription factor [Oscillospiraceae bacterium]
MEQQCVLVVDDEKEIADLVELYLKNEGMAVLKCHDGASALQALESCVPDAAVLDVMLPDMDGFALCSEIRKRFTFPVIMLTAKVEDIDKITGLTIGADDYITKPFNPMELLARVKAQLRRYHRYNTGGEGEAKAASAREHDFLGLVINADTHKCTLYGEVLQLTPIEFSILWTLCENRGRVVSSEELFEAVWKEKYMDSNNTVMAHIARLREKMHEAPRKPKFIKTVWGVGYQIENEG